MLKEKANPHISGYLEMVRDISSGKEIMKLKFRRDSHICLLLREMMKKKPQDILKANTFYLTEGCVDIRFLDASGAVGYNVLTFLSHKDYF